jgi:protein-S-isoprenylcysteine O-methyltransferase Ste14
MVGEAAAVLLVLLPALAVARWTRTETHLPLRAAIQVALSGILFLFLIPEIAFALRPGQAWVPFVNSPSWLRQLELQFVLLLALPGVNAVMEFAQRGGGTPIPYDPPKRLVTSGIYRYCANPMQLSCALVMFAWAAILRNGWLILAAIVSLVYSAGLAHWDEDRDLALRVGSGWKRYRAEVRNWRPRWRPYHAGPPAKLYLDFGCGPCSELFRWINDREPIGLEILDANALPVGSIRRMRYEAHDQPAPEHGIRALGRALEHLNLGWALAGMVLRLPGVWHFVQLVMDASGFGPRIPAGTCQPAASDRLGAGSPRVRY